MDYNSKRKSLILPEYGRNIQIMVDYAKTLPTKELRNEATTTIIDVMGNMFPHLRDIPDFTHKLWDHLMIMADFELDIDSPYPPPLPDVLDSKPNKIPYNQHRLRYKHYGSMTQLFIAKIAKNEDPEARKTLGENMASYMKWQHVCWNKDTVVDATIWGDMKEMSQGKLDVNGIKFPDFATQQQLHEKQKQQQHQNKKRNNNSSNNNNKKRGGKK
ncbi:MAG: DUF4290 domain-containing protein [Bacteroidales bacterium]